MPAMSRASQGKSSSEKTATVWLSTVTPGTLSDTPVAIPPLTVPPVPTTLRPGADCNPSLAACAVLTTDIPAPVSKKNLTGCELLTRTRTTSTPSLKSNGTVAERRPLLNRILAVDPGAGAFGCWPKALAVGAAKTAANVITVNENKGPGQYGST